MFKGAQPRAWIVLRSLLAAVLLAAAVAGCLSDQALTDDRALTDDPPACWRVHVWQERGLYDRVLTSYYHDQVEHVEEGPGPSLPTEGFGPPIADDRWSLERVSRVVPSDREDEFLRYSIEVSEEGATVLSAVRWPSTTEEAFVRRGVAALANTTTASDEDLRGHLEALWDHRSPIGHFPPAGWAAEYDPNDGETRGYEHRLAVDLPLRLREHVGELNTTLNRTTAESRPYSLSWDWDGPEYPLSWSYDFRLAIRTVAVPIEDHRFVLRVGPTDKAFVYSDGDPGFMAPPDPDHQAGRAWVEAGFHKLGLPPPSMGQFTAGGRIC